MCYAISPCTESYSRWFSLWDLPAIPLALPYFNGTKTFYTGALQLIPFQIHVRSVATPAGEHLTAELRIPVLGRRRQPRATLEKLLSSQESRDPHLKLVR
jgi:hypothetical protein